MFLLRVACCLGLLLAANACGGGSGSPAPSNPSPSPPGSGGVTISGREPLGWTQAADSIAGYSFSIYVDGDKRDAPDASCTPATSGTFDCRASLPPISNGVHTLEVSATVSGSGGNVEGPRSAPITVTVNSATTTVASLRIDASGGPGGSPSNSAEQPADRRDGLRCGLAPWDDHRALLWTSQGELSLTAADGSRLPLSWRQADDDGWTLSSAARDTDFEWTQFVFLTLSRRGTSHDWFRVARYREVQGTLGERAVLLEQQIDFHPSGTWTAMDNDGRLLVGLLGASADVPRAHQFITAINTPGGIAVAKLSPVEMDAPTALAFGPAGALAILDRVRPAGLTLHVGGTTTTLTAPEAPIALRSATSNGATHLFVIGADGALLSIENGEIARPLAGLRAATPLQDAVLLQNGTSLGCGVTGDGPSVVYGRWRRVSNDRERR